MELRGVHLAEPLVLGRESQIVISGHGSVVRYLCVDRETQS